MQNFEMSNVERLILKRRLARKKRTRNLIISFLAIVFAKTAKNLFLFSKMYPVFVENVYKFNAFFIKFFVIGWCGCIFASD